MNIQTILAICVALILTCYCLTDERKNPEEPNPNAYHPPSFVFHIPPVALPAIQVC